LTTTTCPECEQEQPNGGDDFCAACGEYLAWMGASRQAAEAQTLARLRTAPKRLPRPAPALPRRARAVIALLQEGERDGTVPVEPGKRLELSGRVRNQSEIVDRYTLVVENLPEHWWTIEPATLHQLPFETGERPEEEFKVILKLPRSPAAQEGRREIKVTAASGASDGKLKVSAPCTLRIEPFDDLRIKVQPERAAGRRRGHLVVTVANASNHEVEVSLSGSDNDKQCRFCFSLVPPRLSRGWHLRTRVHRVLARLRGRGPKVLTQHIPREGELQVDLFVYPTAPLPLLMGRTINHKLTLQVGLAGAVDAEQGSQGDRKSPPHEAVFRQRAWLPWWSSLIVAALLIGAAWWVPKILARVPVPDVVGHPIFEARKELEKGSLEGVEEPAVETTSKLAVCKAHHPEKLVEVGDVFAEHPSAGHRVDPHSKVKLFTAAKCRPARVPDLFDLSAQAAQEALSAAGFAIGEIKPDPPPQGWVVVHQELKPGAKVVGPHDVNVRLGQVAAVPDLIGKQPDAGSQALRSVNLLLGTVTSAHPGHPRSTEVIATQTTAANTVVRVGTTVNVGLGEPVRPHSLHAASKPAAKPKASSKSGAKKAKAGSHAKPTVAPLPALSAGSTAVAATAALTKAGLRSKRTRAISATVPAGRLVRTEPAAGAKVRRGEAVTLVLSVGFPEVAVDDGHSVYALDGVSGKRVATVAAGPQQASEPTWLPDGKSIAYVSDGRVMLTSAEGAGGPVALTPAGERFALPTFPSAPSAPAVIAAIAQRDGGADDLCLLAVAHSSPSCTEVPGWTLGDSIAWAPDGRRLLVEAARTSPAPGVVGLLEFTSAVPFSTRASDWGTGRLATPTAGMDAGVLAGAFSPDGKELALVEDFAGPPAVALVAPSDLALAKATRLPAGQAVCAVQWRTDGTELLVQVGETQSAARPGCTPSLGSLYRLDPAHPGALAFLAGGVAHPSWQPLPGVG
jgi:beta-lactam-binding protein with PASTA domain